MTKKPPKKNRKLSIDANLKKLQEIVDKFEKGEMNIEEGIDHYKEAAKLIREIKSELEGIDLEIEEIRDSYQ